MFETPEERAERERLLRMTEQQKKHVCASPSVTSRTVLSRMYMQLCTLAYRHPTEEGRRQAEKWALEALKVDELNYDEKPCGETAHALSVAYDRLGILSREKGTPDGRRQARAWFRKAHELDGRRYAEAPCYETARALAVSLDRLGDLTSETHTAKSRKEAMDLFREKLALVEKNLGDRPCRDSRHMAATTYEKIAVLTQVSKRPPQSLTDAIVWLERAISLREQNYRDDPDYENRWCLLLDYARLSDLLSASGAQAESAQAMARKAQDLLEKKTLYDYTEGLSLTAETAVAAQPETTLLKQCDAAQKNARENPCFRTKNSVVLALLRLADALREQFTTQSLEEEKALLEKALERAQENERLLPCAGSRWSLMAVLFRLLSRERGLPRTKQETADVGKWRELLRACGERHYREDPCYESRCALISVYDRYGFFICLGKKADDRKKQDLNRKQLELAEQNYAERPCDESIGALVHAYIKLAEVQIVTEHADRDEAEAWILKAKSLRDQLSADARAKNKIFAQVYAVECWFLCAEKIEGLSTHGPVPASIWRRHYDAAQKLAVIASAEPNYRSKTAVADHYMRFSLNASKFYYNALTVRITQALQREHELRTEIYAEYPNYFSRDALAGACVSRAKWLLRDDIHGKSIEAEEAEKLLLQARDLLEENLRERPCRHAVGVLGGVYANLIPLAQKKGTPRGAEEARTYNDRMLQLLDEMRSL